MVPWIASPTIELNLDEPIAQRVRAFPPEAIDAGTTLLRAILDEIPPAVRVAADVVRLRTAGRFQSEARSVAEWVGVSWRDVMLANVSYDLAMLQIGCSTVALPTPNGPVLARNMDWWPEHLLARASCLLCHRKDGRLVFASAGWPGVIGAVTGLSGRGFSVALNAVLSPEGVSTTGYPVLLHLRRVLEDAEGFTSALKMLSEPRLAAACLLTLVGTENDQRVVIERTPARHALRWPVDGKLLVTTNDYRAMFAPQTSDTSELYQTTCNRYDALTTFLADHTAADAIEDAALLYMLSDPTVIQGITAQHVIMRPRTETIQVYVPRHLLAAA